MKTLLGINLIIQFLDGVATYAGTTFHGVPEGNPIVAAAMSSLGPATGLAAAKLVAVAGLLLLYSFARARMAPRAMVHWSLVSVALVYAAFAIVPWAILLA